MIDINTCKCQKPFSEHTNREIDVCVAKDKGLLDAGYHHVQGELTGLDGGYQYVYTTDKGLLTEIPHYSTDIRDATTLWKDDWVLAKTHMFWFIHGMKGFVELNTTGDLKASSENLATAICHARLIEAKGDE